MRRVRMALRVMRGLGRDDVGVMSVRGPAQDMCLRSK